MLTFIYFDDYKKFHFSKSASPYIFSIFFRYSKVGSYGLIEKKYLFITQSKHHEYNISNMKIHLTQILELGLVTFISNTDIHFHFIEPLTSLLSEWIRSQIILISTIYYLACVKIQPRNPIKYILQISHGKVI